MTRVLKLILFFICIANNSFCLYSNDTLQKLTHEQALLANKMQEYLQRASRYQNIMPDSALHYYSQIIPAEFNKDALYAKWLNETPTTLKYYVAVALSQSAVLHLTGQNTEKGISYFEKAYDISAGIKEYGLAAYCSDNLALFYLNNSNYSRALKFFNYSLEIYNSTEDVNNIISCLGNIGSVHANMGNLYGAAFYYEKLIDLKDQSPSAQVSFNEILNIAFLYYKLEEHYLAINFLEKALDHSLEKEQFENINLILTTLGSCYFKLDKYSNSLDYYKQYLNNAEETNSVSDIMNASNNIAIVYYQLNDLDSSEAAWLKSLKIAREIGDEQTVFDALLNLSNIYTQKGNNEKAIQYYENYLGLAEQFNDYQFTAQSYLTMGNMLLKSGNYPDAREYFLKANKKYHELNNYSQLANTNNLIAQTFLNQSLLHEAFIFFNQNLEHTNIIDSTIIAKTHEGIADTYRKLRQIETAENHYNSALNIYKMQGSYDNASSALNSLAHIYEMYGNLPKSISLYEEALEFVSKSSNKSAEAAIYNNLGIVYRQLGDLSRARNSYLKSLETYSQTDNQEAIAYCYNNLGIIYELSGDYVNAINYYEKSYAIKEQFADQQGIASSLVNMGNIHRTQGRFQLAYDYYERSYEISEQTSDIQGKAVVLLNISALYLETGNLKLAIDYALRSRDLSEQAGFQNTLREANKQLAWAYHLTDQPFLAEKAYIVVIDIIYQEIERNFSILSENEKELFFETVAGDFDRFYSFALDRKDSNSSVTKQVYNSLLKNKGLLLKSSTAMRNAILSSNNDNLITNFEQWIHLKQDIAQLYTQPANERGSDVNILEEQANELERWLVRNSAEFGQMEKFMNITWKDVKNALGPYDAAIEFTHFKDSNDSTVYCAMLIKPYYESPEFIYLFKESELENVIGTFTGNNYQYINDLYGSRHKSKTMLYEMIWKPLDKYLNNTEKVFISPSGLLHKISFAALNKGPNEYLSYDYQILNLSSTAHIVISHELKITNNTAITLFGGITYNIDTNDNSWSYLPGTLEEVKKIEQITGKSIPVNNIFTGQDATEDAFKAYASKSNIIHIATHGFFFPDLELIEAITEFETKFEDIKFRGQVTDFAINNFVNNTNSFMRSGLVFAGVNDYWSGLKTAAGDDGVLTALEVINIDMRNTELVVLSACETGLGEIKGSEGVYGLQRAFKMAGADYLIMSLWQVPDKETVEFMNLFYEYLVEENNLHKAFLNTQKVMSQKYDPYFWAAFVLIE